MLTRWYLERQLERLRKSDAPFSVASPTALVKTADVTRLIFASSEFFYAGPPLLRQFFAVEDQTMATKEKVMLLAASLAAAGGLPPQGAVVRAATEAGLTLRELEADRLGRTGVIAKLDRTWYLLGDEEILQEEQIEVGVSVQRLVHQMEHEGLYCFFLAQKQPKRLLGVFACEYPVDQHGPRVIEQLTGLGIESVLVSSARQMYMKGLAKQLGIHLLHTELSAREKQEVIQQLLDQQPHTAVVTGTVRQGAAPFSIAVGSRPPKGADVWLADLSHLPDLIESSREAVGRVRSRLFWATLKS